MHHGPAYTVSRGESGVFSSEPAAVDAGSNSLGDVDCNAEKHCIRSLSSLNNGQKAEARAGLGLREQRTAAFSASAFRELISSNWVSRRCIG